MKFLIPSASLIPWPKEKIFRLAEETGFDGVEVLLSPRLNPKDIVGLAKAHNALLHWHEVWSLEDGSMHWFNYVAATLGVIPKKTGLLEEQLPVDLVHPVVAYAHRLFSVKEPSSLIWFQTALTAGVEVDYLTFVKRATEHDAPIVFDTQHVLELRHGVVGVDKLSGSAQKLQLDLMRSWEDVGSCVKEIHLNNFDPAWGGTNGRNVLPDQGILDLHAFAKEVRESGWQGVVTPEVTPASVSNLWLPRTPFGVPTYIHLSNLREMVGEMFE